MEKDLDVLDSSLLQIFAMASYKQSMLDYG
jgi:hypothetical protein